MFWKVPSPSFTLRVFYAVLVLCCLLSHSSFGQSSGGPYQVTQSVIAGGGGTSSSGTMQLDGTAGQSATEASSGGTFSIFSGFWLAVALPTSTLSVPNATGTYGGNVSLTATLSSSGTSISNKSVTFTLNGTSVGTATTDTNGLATLTGVSLSNINAGSYAGAVTAQFAGDLAFAASDAVGQLIVQKATPLLQVTGGSFTYDGQPHGAAASATGVNNEALGPITLLYNGAGDIPVNAGTYSITATFAGNQNYNSAVDNQQSIIINKASQTITFGALSNKTFGDADFAVTATASSGLTVSFSTTTPTVCSVGGNTVTILTAGTCTIRASQSGDNNYNAATTVDQSFNVSKANQTITFGAPGNKTFGDADFTVSATASSNLAVSFTASGQCSVTGNTVQITGAGSCTITAKQAGDSNYNAAADVPQIFNIAKAATTTAITSSVNPSEFGQSVTFTATVAATPGTPTGTVTFKDGAATIPSCSNVNLVSGIATCAISSLTPGNHTITADYSGDANFAGSAGTLAGGQQVNVNASISINDAGVTEGDSGTKSMDFTVTLSAHSNLTVTVDFSTANGTATAGSDYQSTSGTLTFNPGEINKTITVLVQGDSADEPNETFFINLSNAVNAAIGDSQATGSIQNDDAPVVQFTSSGYSFSEGAGHGDIIVKRTGDTSTTVSVDYQTSMDPTAALIPCQAPSSGHASERCDYTTANGTLTFLPGETEKTIRLIITDDAYVEPSEQLSIVLGTPKGAVLGSVPTAIVLIDNNDTLPATENPIDNLDFFIRQMYADFLGREPEAAGLQFWKARMTNNCPQGQQCDRIDTALRFFGSDEFRERGYFIYLFYHAALGRRPTYSEWILDVSKLNGPKTISEQEAAKAAFVEEFMSRQEFMNLYNSAQTGQSFIDLLMQKSGVTPASRQQLVNNYDTLGRAKTLRAFMETSEVQAAFIDRAFVSMLYFGFLRRDAETGGFQFWMQKLNDTNHDYRFLVGGFMQSDEYRFRFALISNAP